MKETFALKGLFPPNLKAATFEDKSTVKSEGLIHKGSRKLAEKSGTTGVS